MSPRNSPPIEGAPAVGVTATFYPDTDDVRLEAALNTAEEWSEQELPLVVIDGSPDDKVAGAFRARGAFVRSARRLGIASQRREGAKFVIDQGGNKIITLEPEKSMAHLALKIAEMLKKCSVVVIGRTEASKESMPPFQRRTEKLIGWLFEYILGMPADALAGPRGYNRQGMQHLLDYPSDAPGMNNWLYMYYTVLAAMANGERVGEIKVDLIYPKSMVEQETDNLDFDRKRYEQAEMQAHILLGRESEAPQDYAAELQRIKLLNELDDKKAALRDMILKELTLMPKDPTIERIQEFFDRVEAIAMLFGYKVGVDADGSR
ncbi:glycosyltransferase family protein [Candidatus Nanosynbacter lyticus]|uniref:hypothetical protein n=1 Tax=Candidatus Nanosynbacter lyticus TaxID=2093824 RepID=UPI002553FB5E|nr:hypothetical protein [Candidatus Nanosynbacter lyticus]WLD47224.1 hypothetical protein NLML1_0874 [Candidatus Nanosynbacter lyticus]